MDRIVKMIEFFKAESEAQVQSVNNFIRIAISLHHCEAFLQECYRLGVVLVFHQYDSSIEEAAYPFLLSYFTRQ